MHLFTTKNSILNYENRFYLNGNAISGVLSVQGNYSVNYGPINTIGVGYNKQVMAEVPSASFSVNKYLIHSQQFQQVVSFFARKKLRI